MTWNDLVSSVAEVNNMSKAAAREIVDSILEAIAVAAENGDEISLTGFGKFKITNRPARDGRNPRTGEIIKLPASKKIGFFAAAALKDRLA
jgi:DNA-binding protein HU-beta